ncbi:hypothetical protein TWF106_009846 [Orbilia oligospora]|uniref:Uncharacterized protein n=1 Tax=Orbilia oligospora TaxID=2813651 RepID=A0A6G1LZ71_ORBOL|nr:hypothetical protein TWF106_009846 [Orbilia oligospora]KAF3238490.1 hypothetical protein TWF192_010325 [Orbilia oligospora]
MPALQGFDDLQRRFEGTINEAVERAVTAAVERAVPVAVERAIAAAIDRTIPAVVDRAVEQAFEKFRRDNDGRESLTSARLHNARIDDTAPLWFPSGVLDAGALHTHIPNKIAIDVLSFSGKFRSKKGQNQNLPVSKLSWKKVDVISDYGVE